MFVLVTPAVSWKLYTSSHCWSMTTANRTIAVIGLYRLPATDEIQFHVNLGAILRQLCRTRREIQERTGQGCWHLCNDGPCQYIAQ